MELVLYWFIPEWLRYQERLFLQFFSWRWAPGEPVDAGSTLRKMNEIISGLRSNRYLSQSCLDCSEPKTLFMI